VQDDEQHYYLLSGGSDCSKGWQLAARSPSSSAGVLLQCFFCAVGAMLYARRERSRAVDGEQGEKKIERCNMVNGEK
jgi:hypothetical protein